MAVIALTGVHLVAFALLACDVLLASPREAPNEGADDGDGGFGHRPSPPSPPPTGSGPPLADAALARARLRAPGRLHDAYPPVPRRGDRPPEPGPRPAAPTRREPG